jgi:phosphinothricin acetyltransferase
VLIRHADPERDAAACAAIYAPFVSDSAVSFEETPPDPEEFARRIVRVSERYPFLVADEDGDVAGYAYASQHRERAAYRWATDATVYLAERYRRRGIGRALYDRLFDLLSRQGFRTAISGITLPNPASVALHEACGFQLVGVYRSIGYKQGAWRDVGWWQLELSVAGGDPPEEPGPPVRLDR